MSTRIADVLIPLALDTAYSYRVPEDLGLVEGDVIVVPLGTRETVGVVWGLSEGGGANLKAVSGKVDAPRLSPALRKLFDWLAWYTLAPRGSALALGLRVPEPRPEVARVGVRLADRVPARMTAARRRVLEAAADGLTRSKRELADAMPIQPSDRILDVGSGLGGPARYVASRFGCRVTGIDLTPEFCAVARHLTTLVGLDNQASFEVGDALRMPFADASFDGAYSMNVSMNIADKPALYRELRRVLEPGGWLLLSEIARGDGPEPQYPMPWAATAATSFLATPDQTRAALEAAGFEVRVLQSTRDRALEFGERSRAAVARGEKPPHRAVMLVHGDRAADAMKNSSRALGDRSQGRTVEAPLRENLERGCQDALSRAGGRRLLSRDPTGTPARRSLDARFIHLINLPVLDYTND